MLKFNLHLLLRTDDVDETDEEEKTDEKNGVNPNPNPYPNPNQYVDFLVFETKSIFNECYIRCSIFATPHGAFFVKMIIVYLNIVFSNQ